jgi:pyruvate/2-oxoglutarate dehydrogenase complex dihydrolipoamide dehydrogenase (E3) component
MRVKFCICDFLTLQRTFSAENIVLATGTRPRFPSQVSVDSMQVLFTDCY